jgi:threonine/homoserine/homoserine lactone efflux protein
METAALLAFAGVAAMLIVVPGPDWALVLGVGSRGGLVAPAIAGLAVGYVLVTMLVVAGVAPLVAAEPTVLVVLTLVGAAYLLHLGVGILRQPPADLPTAGQPPEVGSTVKALRQGVGVSALNPKALLFFLAFLPQFARPGAPWPLAVQLAVLGGIWIVLTSSFYAVLGMAVQRILRRRPSLTRTLTRVSGAAMVLAGVTLSVEQLLHHTTLV